MEYLRDYRLAIADTLLINTEKSIADIAELCGFESSNYFCRCYKKGDDYVREGNEIIQIRHGSGTY